jgi:hypothetical protein
MTALLAISLTMGASCGERAGPTPTEQGGPVETLAFIRSIGFGWAYGAPDSFWFDLAQERVLAPDFSESLTTHTDLADAPTARQWLAQSQVKMLLIRVYEDRPTLAAISVRTPEGGAEANALATAAGNLLVSHLNAALHARFDEHVAELGRRIEELSVELADVQQAIEARLGDASMADIEERAESALAELKALNEQIVELEGERQALAEGSPRAEQIAASLRQLRANVDVSEEQVRGLFVTRATVRQLRLRENDLIELLDRATAELARGRAMRESQSFELQGVGGPVQP